MKISIIKSLVEAYSIEELIAAEAAILEERKPEVEVEGEDEGEQLTHIMAANWIKEYMKAENKELKEAVRAYTVKVRSSIT